jgi:hypothetical protein
MVFLLNNIPAEFPKVQNVPNILHWTFQIFLNSAAVSTISNACLLLAGTFEDINVQFILILIEEMSIQKCIAEFIDVNLRKYLSKLRRLRNNS